MAAANSPTLPSRSNHGPKSDATTVVSDPDVSAKLAGEITCAATAPNPNHSPATDLDLQGEARTPSAPGAPGRQASKLGGRAMTSITVTQSSHSGPRSVPCAILGSNSQSAAAIRKAGW
jgi:hypothetical protein